MHDAQCTMHNAQTGTRIIQRQGIKHMRKALVVYEWAKETKDSYLLAETSKIIKPSFQVYSGAYMEFNILLTSPPVLSCPMPYKMSMK